jgi:hypothetical protein
MRLWKRPSGNTSSRWTVTATNRCDTAEPTVNARAWLENTRSDATQLNATATISGPTLLSGRRAHAYRPAPRNPHVISSDAAIQRPRSSVWSLAAVPIAHAMPAPATAAAIVQSRRVDAVIRRTIVTHAALDRRMR